MTSIGVVSHTDDQPRHERSVITRHDRARRKTQTVASSSDASARLDEDSLCGVAVNGDTFHTVRNDASAEVRLVEHPNPLMLTQAHLVESECETSVNIDSADFDIHAQRACSQRFDHGCEITRAHPVV